MCVNQREIVNKYTRQKLYVKCGKCPACLQEKASHRVLRIKNTETKDNEVLMVSLTYDRKSVPFVYRDMAYRFAKGELPELPVFRGSYVRKVRLDAKYHVGYHRLDDTVMLDRVSFCDSVDFGGLRDLKFQKGKIGVCYYPDVQRFMARLRLNLKRNFNYDKSFKAYCCSEYGAKSYRPHFHLLLFVSKGDYSLFRSAIIASWPFSRLQDFGRSVEKAFRASSYVASYVNCGSKFPRFLKDYFRPKHSYSKGFGLGNYIFQLSEILSRFERGSLQYRVLTSKEGLPAIRDVPIPKYVIHRYFPKFVGYSRIPPTSLVENIRRIMLCYKSQYNRSVEPLYLDDDNFHKSSVRLNNAYDKFIADSPLGSKYKKYTIFDYARLHASMWNLYNSTVLRLHMCNDSVPLNEKYDNLGNVVGMIKTGALSMPVGFTDDMLKVTDPNDFLSVRARTAQFAQGYRDNIKHRKVNNTVAMQLSEQW